MNPSGKTRSMYHIFHRFREFFSDLFHRIFPGWKKTALYCTQPLPPVTEELGQVNWSARDSMVGTVRNREQLHYNLSHNCYYVPARFMPEDQPPVVYIALHERDAEDIPSIVRIGRVKAVEQVERRTIPVTMRKETDPKEPYFYFTIEEWVSLPHRILIRDTARGRPLFTNKFLLDHCRASYELFVISSREDYLLLKGIYALLGPRGEDRPVCTITENRRLTLRNGTLTLTNVKDEPLGVISVKAYAANPRSTFLYLKKFLP